MRICEIIEEVELDEIAPIIGMAVRGLAVGAGKALAGAATSSSNDVEEELDEEELEEVKVTKTLAGKRSTPSRDLAMKHKKKSPNQGKPAVEIHKRRGAKELANIQLKGEY
jgi:hypothetical protein